MLSWWRMTNTSHLEKFNLFPISSHNAHTHSCSTSVTLSAVWSKRHCLDPLRYYRQLTDLRPAVTEWDQINHVWIQSSTGPGSDPLVLRFSSARKHLWSISRWEWKNTLFRLKMMLKEKLQCPKNSASACGAQNLCFRLRIIRFSRLR